MGLRHASDRKKLPPPLVPTTTEGPATALRAHSPPETVGFLALAVRLEGQVFFHPTTCLRPARGRDPRRANSITINLHHPPRTWQPEQWDIALSPRQTDGGIMLEFIIGGPSEKSRRKRLSVLV